MLKGWNLELCVENCIPNLLQRIPIIVSTVWSLELRMLKSPALFAFMWLSSLSNLKVFFVLISQRNNWRDLSFWSFVEAKSILVSVGTVVNKNVCQILIHDKLKDIFIDINTKVGYFKTEKYVSPSKPLLFRLSRISFLPWGSLRSLYGHISFLVRFSPWDVSQFSSLTFAFPNGWLP